MNTQQQNWVVFSLSPSSSLSLSLLCFLCCVYLTVEQRNWRFRQRGHMGFPQITGSFSSADFFSLSLSLSLSFVLGFNFSDIAINSESVVDNDIYYRKNTRESDDFLQ